MSESTRLTPSLESELDLGLGSVEGKPQESCNLSNIFRRTASINAGHQNNLHKTTDDPVLLGIQEFN